MWANLFTMRQFKRRNTVCPNTLKIQVCKAYFQFKLKNQLLVIFPRSVKNIKSSFRHLQ